MKYDYKKIEDKWQRKWQESEIYKADDDSKKEKRYILDMFPYPSGAGLHVGHVESYTATDIYSRCLRMKGYNVLHPQGWDAFGLPAENYAIKTGVHPSKTTQEAIKTFKRQMNSLGLSYDWSREINSSKLEYYKWTQWFFLMLYKNGLAYKKKAKVNWCNSCQTVLANEQAEGGKCERCEKEVVQKDLEQWFFRITDFIEDQEHEGKEIKGLLSGLDTIDWPESTKIAQRNWIGKSVGAEVDFEINGERITVFTTRPDTLFGATYFVLSPEHSIVEKYKAQITNYKEIEGYVKKAKKKTELERTDLAKEKTGVELKGIRAINPVNKENIPVFIADYVLSGYGTGAIMAVPAHDERDHEFAVKYSLPIIEVVEGGENIQEEAYLGDGKAVNSQILDGLKTLDAKKKIIKWLEKKNLGKKAINYKIRDWLVSRQRYWGAPIPIIHCEKCGEVPVPEKDLPVELPTDVDFKPTGESPLKYSRVFQNVNCPKCGESARRESDTMDTFVCSSWYYLRYADPNNNKKFADKKLIKKWLPIDTYVGGAEHTVLHLLYSRFFTKALQKFGYIDFNEPFTKLRHQGIILAEDGTKMSKSKGNVVSPDDVVKKYGADILRMYEMFMGPIEDMKPWNMKGIIGMQRFLFDEKDGKDIDRYLQRVYGLIIKMKEDVDKGILKTNNDYSRTIHKTIKKITSDIEDFKFNTAIAELMIFFNGKNSKPDWRPKLNSKGKWEKVSKIGIAVDIESAKKFILLLASFAPHISEELWEKLGHKESIFKEDWPKYDPALAKDETIQLVIQINGKLRDTVEVDADISEAKAKKTALESEKIKKWLKSKEIMKIIFVKGKLINIVIK